MASSLAKMPASCGLTSHFSFSAALSSGTIFEAPEGSAPERDRKGELAFRPISYTPWPVGGWGRGAYLG